MSNFNFNKAILGGRLTSDPELRTTSSGIPVTSFTLAVNRRNRGANDEVQADFISCVAWRQNAEFISKFFRKGSSICVVGTIQTRNWTDNTGAKRYTTEVIIDEAMFVDSKSESGMNSFAPAAQPAFVPDEFNAGAAPAGAAPAPKFEEITEDDDLPF